MVRLHVFDTDSDGGPRVQIFISYSSKYAETCERLQLALEADGRHEVFRDRSELTPGQPFDEKIREAVLGCDLLLFLLSPESVAAGSYALAELDMAKSRWRHPGGHVLPVKVAPVPKDAIPPYLRAVTILEPQGDLVAETVAAVERMRSPSARRRVFVSLALGAVCVAAAAIGTAVYLQSKKQRAEEALAAAQTATAQQLCDAGDHTIAWQRFGEALTQHPASLPLRRAREDCAMRWLREIHVEAGKETFTDVVNRVLPVLAEGASSATGERGADLQAHMGWADYLRIREGAAGLDPQARYVKALALAPANVFAHAMWGHHVMVTHGPIEDAKQHFSAAVAANRERPFVRTLQFAALLYYHDAAGSVEAARAANEMRKGGETLSSNQRERLWTYVYYDRLLSPDRRPAFMAEMTDPDNVATFRWLFAENGLREDRRMQWRYFLASLEEASGDRATARARYEALRDELLRQKSSGRMLDETVAAIRRLGSP